MAIEQKARLPFADDFPVNVQIRIQPLEREYVAYIQAYWAKWHRVHIPLKQHDVEILNAGLQQAIEQVAGYFEEGRTLPAARDALAELARKGNFVFKTIFAESSAQETIRSALQPGTTVQVTSEEFFLPWELLYDGPLGTEVDINRFWGMQHIISRALIQDARPGDFVSPVIQTARPRVGVAACHALAHVSSREIPALQKLHQQGQIYLLLLRSLNSSRHEQELAEFAHFLSEKIEIAHLACHAYEKQPLTLSYLLVSDEFPITIEDFRVYDLGLEHNPLVILNACRTGTMNPLYTSNWAALFWERGARGVLATEFRVPDWFAASFIEELYPRFLSGKPIGPSLLAVRQHFWNQKGNPLGLAYALYSSPSIRIEK